MKTAIIFGVTGQDGSYLAEYLLGLGYRVIGVARRVSTPNHVRLARAMDSSRFELIHGDITDPFCVQDILLKHRHANEVYNLAAQSHVGLSFEEERHTTEVVYLGCLNILRSLLKMDKVRFYQASSSEMFGSAYSWYKGPNHIVHETRLVGKEHLEPVNPGGVVGDFQCEETPMIPNSPYAIAKLAAHHAVRMYRDIYGLHASCGILFNHESERRGENFVTRKITKYVANWVKARLCRTELPPLKLGNMDARRDWGHAQDYVRAMHYMLHQNMPDDYVIATGKHNSVSDFLKTAFGCIGITSNLPVIIDRNLFRPSEVPYLRGDATKAKRVLGWSPNIGFNELVRTMVYADIAELCGTEIANNEVSW